MRKVGELEKAEKLLRKCLELDPENNMAHGGLSMLLAEKKEKRGAHAHGELGLELAPDEDLNHFTLGATYLQTGHPFKARRHLREALRIDPGDSGVEELYLHADRACRFVYLPFYFWSFVLERVPGQQFAVWFAFIALVQIMRVMDVDSGPATIAVGTYIAFVLYTWVADPIVSLWVKLVPPK